MATELPDRVKKALDGHIKWRERLIVAQERVATAQEKVKQSHEWLCTEMDTVLKGKDKKEDKGFDYGPPPSDDDVPF